MLINLKLSFYIVQTGKVLIIYDLVKVKPPVLAKKSLSIPASIEID